MATLAELLADKTKSDETKITIEGVETNFGELRKALMMQSDYTKKTTQTAEERRQLAQQREMFDQERTQWELSRADAEAKLADFAKQIVQGNPRSTADDVVSAIEGDPVMRKLYAEVQEAKAELANLKKADAEKADYLRKLELARFEDQHRAVLAKLKADDAELDEEALITHAKNRMIPRLDVAYRDMKFEERVEAARKEGQKKGLEEGMTRMKKELSQPVIPPRRVLSPMPEAPKGWNDAVDAALSDPEIMNIVQGLDN